MNPNIHYYAIVQKEETICTTFGDSDRDTAIKECIKKYETDFDTKITDISSSYQEAALNELVIIECTEDLHMRHQAGYLKRFEYTIPFFYFREQNVLG